MSTRSDVAKLANSCARQMKADVFLYNGPIQSPLDYHIIDLCRKRDRRENLLLLLITSGGDAHAAYRIGRCFQDKYNKITAFIPGWCKSGGTLVAVAANELIIGDFGELGPIDVQRTKADEVWQRSSGLTEETAMATLQTSVSTMFEEFVSQIRDMSGGQIGFRAAAEVVSPMIVGTFSPIFEQIDPFMIGENARAVQIASDYGNRLNIKGKNLRSTKSMEILVSGYPDHGFVIDRSEARSLFLNVSVPNNMLEELCLALGSVAHFPPDDMKSQRIEYLNDVPRKRKVRKRRKAEKSNARIAATRAASTATDDEGAVGGTAEATQAGAGSNVSPLRRSDET